MSGVPCRNGNACTRPDCWFVHPDGRGGKAPQYANAPQYQQSSYVPTQGGYAPPRSNYGGAPSRPAQSNPGNVCKFGRSCHREGCYFTHPDGREIDEGPPAGAISAGPGAKPNTSNYRPSNSFDGEEWEEEGEMPTEEEFFAAQGGIQACECCGGRPLECTTPQCAAAGRCGCLLGESAEDGAEDDSWRDEWFPEYRNCPCCAGSIYRCKRQQDDCVSGNCFCSLQKANTNTATAQ